MYYFHNKLQIMVDDKALEITYKKEDNMLVLPKNYDLSYLLDVIKNYNFSNLKILSTCLINEEILKCIRDNNHIFSVTLGSTTDPYILTRSDFDILNASESLFDIKTSGVEGSYSSREMDYLSFFENVHIGQYKLADIYVLDSFYFYEPLSEKELLYLSQYMRSSVNIFFEHNNYDNIISVIKTLINKHITFNIREYSNLSNYFEQFKKLLEENEKIQIIEYTNLKQYIYINNYLDTMIKDIKEASLSPYEKYLAVYELVTHFKSGLDNIINCDDARNLELILFNEYIVCTGFSKLLIALLNKVGIKAFDVGIEFYKKSEEINFLDYAQLSQEKIKVKLGNIAYHSRVLMRLVDSKYQIDGLFIADPTWDNDLEHHYFNHSLMLPYEMNFEKEEFYETDVSIFDIQSSEEFLEKIKRLPNAINFFLEVLKCVDIDYFNYLKKNYDLDINDAGFILELYNYIITHTKRSVSKENKDKALNVLFDFIYSDLKLSYFKEIIAENENRDKLYFKKGSR